MADNKGSGNNDKKPAPPTPKEARASVAAIEVRVLGGQGNVGDDGGAQARQDKEEIKAAFDELAVLGAAAKANGWDEGEERRTGWWSLSR